MLETIKKIIIGYICAVAISSYASLASCIFLTKQFETLLALLSPLIFLFCFGFTGLFALPGWLFFVVMSESLAIRSNIYFCLSGATTSLLAIRMLHFVDSTFMDSSSDRLENLLFTISAAIGGTLGGLTYWAIAGKHSGAWKTTP